MLFLYTTLLILFPLFNAQILFQERVDDQVPIDIFNEDTEEFGSFEEDFGGATEAIIIDDPDEDTIRGKRNKVFENSAKSLICILVWEFLNFRAKKYHKKMQFL